MKKGEPVVPIGPSDLRLAAHLFNPTRLTLARELRGLTKLEIADRVGKTGAAIGQFETGRSRPDAKTLAALSLALGLPLGFFTRRDAPAILSTDSCHFRSLRSAGQRERKKVIAIGILLLDVMSHITEYVELPSEHVSRVSQSPDSSTEIEECAVKVRKDWGLGLGPIPKVVGLLESKGIMISMIPEACPEVDAFSAWHEARPLIFLVQKRSTSRTRFDAAHELGHLVMHADVVPGNQDSERQANQFAGAFLVPREPFLLECPRRLDWDHFYELKRRWKVSVAALVRRAFDLGCLTESSYRRAYIHLNQSGERTQERDEPPAEHPCLLAKSLALVTEDTPIEQISARLGLSVADLLSLVGPMRP